jgi:hypothetical protein
MYPAGVWALYSGILFLGPLTWKVEMDVKTLQQHYSHWPP